MKTIYTIIVSLTIFSLTCNAQTIKNSGAKINVPDGTHLVFHDLYNSGTDASFYYNTSLSVAGNWTNISPAIFSSGANGNVTFNGSSLQTVQSGGSAFGDVIINNDVVGDYAIELTDNMIISENLDLTSGIVNGNGNKVVIQNGATSSIGNINSFVDGQVERTGSTAFIFPTGNINQRDLNNDSSNEDYIVWAPIEASPQSSATVTVSYFFDNQGMPDWWEHGGNMDETLHHVSDREYWTVNSPVTLTNVTLYWKNNDHVGEICIHSLCDGNEANYDPFDLSVAYWNNMWVDAGGTAMGNHDIGSITAGPIPFSAKGSTYITLGSKEDIDPLPVELMRFYSECIDNTVVLHWLTASEINSMSYIVEKSLDANNFEEIGYIAAAGNSNEILSYSFIDEINQKQTKYYRLKIVDIDGTFEYSNIISANCFVNEAPSIMVYPNPFKNFVHFKGENLESEDTKILIYDMLGRLIYSHQTENSFGNFTTEIDLSELCPAMYVAKVICGDFTKTFKIEKHQ
ncbi:MAG: T9SS type A sorting domain-containing protein [Bacteroidales bacterium]|nr:T9SS type A sorting domain-containing protein [Bacteroidales bacterium]